MTRKPVTIDEYLAAVGPDQRRALAKLRKDIRAAAPRAEECISYGMPAYRQGRMLVGFRAATKHCAFHMWSSSTIAAHAKALAGYDTSVGTIRFAPAEPLPSALVRKLVKTRLAENAALDKRGRRS